MKVINQAGMSGRIILHLCFFSTAMMAAIVCSSNAHAVLVTGETIGLDFGALTGGGGGDPSVSPTNNFNAIATADAVDLSIADAVQVSDGASTGVSITLKYLNAGVDQGVDFSAFNTTPFQNGNTEDNLTGLPSFFQTSHVTDLVGLRARTPAGNLPTGDGGFLIEFSGLDDSAQYDLVAVSGENAPALSDGMEATVNGGTAVAFTGTPADLRFLTFSGVSSSSGQISLLLDSADIITISAASLTAVAVPEVSSFLCFATLTLLGAVASGRQLKIISAKDSK